MPKFATVVLLVLLSWGAPAQAEAIADMNALAVRHAGPPAGNAAIATLAVVNLAMFDAANAIERRFKPYLATPAPPAGIDAEAAALAAGCAALAAQQPAQKTAIEQSCETIAKSLSAGAMTDAARAFGKSVADATVASRRGDGMGAPNRYRPFTTAGTYVPTALPVGWDVATMKPMAMTSDSQLRPGPPPALTSETYARDYNEVRTLGARTSATRTPEQTATAQFWSLPGFTQFVETIPVDAVPAGPGVAGRARYYALMYMTLLDVGIGHFDAKYAYNFWRPITAIRNGDIDGNSATDPDAGWMSLLDTPLHPEYPCAHCNSASAFATVLAALTPPGKPLVILGANNARREYANAAAVAADAVNARVWAGVHFRTSGEAGAALGRRLGDYILATQLLPLQ